METIKFKKSTITSEEIELSLPCYLRWHDWQYMILDNATAYVVKPDVLQIEKQNPSIFIDYPTNELSTKKDFDEALIKVASGLRERLTLTELTITELDMIRESVKEPETSLN